MTLTQRHSTAATFIDQVDAVLPLPALSELVQRRTIPNVPEKAKAE